MTQNRAFLVEPLEPTVSDPRAYWFDVVQALKPFAPIEPPQAKRFEGDFLIITLDFDSLKTAAERHVEVSEKVRNLRLSFFEEDSHEPYVFLITQRKLGIKALDRGEIKTARERFIEFVTRSYGEAVLPTAVDLEEDEAFEHELAAADRKVRSRTYDVRSKPSAATTEQIARWGLDQTTG